MTWWQRLRRRDQLETELDAELRFHFERLVAEHLQRGLFDQDARRQARLAFGGLDQVKEDCRDARGTRWIEDLAQDFRFAGRLLGKHRSFTLVATIVLALGIGVNGVFLTLVEMICIRGLPLDRVDRVMYVGTRDAHDRNRGVSYPDFEDVRAGTRSFTGIAAFAASPMAVSDEGLAPDRFPGAFVSANAFRLAGEAPLVGRDFQPKDDRLGAPAVVIIGYRVWRTRYGGDPSLVGQTIRVNGVPSVVLGVMPERFRFPTNADVWQPLALMPDLANQRRDARVLGVFGRLVDGATPAGARAELDAIAARLAREYPETNEAVRMTAVPINERYNGNITDPAWLAFITAGGLILLIACANVANLLLMRSSQRSREIAIRASLGATRRRVIRQLLAESTLIAALGGLAGLGLSLAGLRVVSSFTPPGVLPYWMDFTMNVRIFAFLATVCLGTTFAFGLLPALQLSKTDVNGVLKDGGPTGGGAFRGRWWTTAFLVSQFALALLLLTHLALGVRLLLAERDRDPAIDMPRLLTMSVALPNQTYPTAAGRIAFFERLDDKLRNIGPVSSAAIASALPFGGAATRQLVIDGVPAATGRPRPTVWTLAVGPRYFETLGLPVIRGRAFDDRDGTPGHENAIVNQRFVEMNFPNTDPLGHRIRVTSESTADSAPWFTVVGISPSVRQRPAPEPDPVVYLPYRAEPPPTAALIVRGPPKPAAIAPAVREEVRALDPDLPLYRIMTMEQAVKESQWNGRTSNLLITIITCIAVGLSALGLYAVTSYTVIQRTQEIGLRMAMGGQPRQVAWLVLRRATLPLGLGLIVGVACTMAWERLFANYSAAAIVLSDPLNVTAAAALLVLVAAVACVAPTRRAARLDPLLALRHE